MASLRSRHTQRTNNVVVKMAAPVANGSTADGWESAGAPASEVSATVIEQQPPAIPLAMDEPPHLSNFPRGESTPVEPASQSDADAWMPSIKAALPKPALQQGALQFPPAPPKQKRNSDLSDFEIRAGPNGAFMISSNIAGLMIGVKGENFKAITSATGCRMIVDNTTPGVFKQLNFSGQPPQVVEAKKRIREWMEAEKTKRGMGGMNGTARAQSEFSHFKPADGDFPPLGNKSALVNEQTSYADAAGRPNGATASSPDKASSQRSCSTPPGFETLIAEQPKAEDARDVKDIWGRQQSPFASNGSNGDFGGNNPLPPAFGSKNGTGLTTSIPLPPAYCPKDGARMAAADVLPLIPGVPSLVVQPSPSSVLPLPSSTASMPTSTTIGDLACRFACSVAMLEQDYQKRLEQANEKIVGLEKQVVDMRESMVKTHEFHLKHSICIMCQSAPREILFDNCCHFTHCARCAQRLDRCPTCFLPVIDKKQVRK